jgi:hypothetical protein
VFDDETGDTERLRRYWDKHLGEWAKTSGELGRDAKLPDYSKRLDDRFLGGTRTGAGEG